MTAPLLVLATIGGSFACLKWAPLPYVWISVCWAGCLTGLLAASKTLASKRVFLAMISLALALGSVEVFAWSRENPRGVHRYSEEYITRDEILGYAPIRNKSVVAELSYHDRRIYKVTYTIDAQGLRVSPPGPVRSDRCVLFFGDSFTFGEGVEDSETMPYVVGSLSGARVFNFGFQGYGPHQMLAAVESGRVRNVVDCRPRAIVYQAILAHPSRAAAASWWDPHGPRYVLTREGLMRSGHFDDYLGSRIQMQLAKSFLYARYLVTIPPVVAQRSELFAEIVDATRRALARDYEDAEFEVVFWNSGESAGAAALDHLKAHNVPVRLVSEILPGYRANAGMFQISRYDNHPNARAHRLIAGDIVSTMLR